VDNEHANAAGNSIASSSTPADLNWSDPTYNSVGAMTSIPKPGTEATARALVWDAWGRLVEAKDNGTTVWIGRYDGQHRLIRTTVGAAVRDNYLDEQGREVEVRTGGGAGTLAELYIWARSGDRLLRTATVAVGVPTWRAVICDQQGSATALVTDGTKTVVERYRYDAYGVRTVADANGTPLDQNVSNNGMRYGYTGRPFDSVTGLGYYRARWYHPSLGRFISRDPAGYIDGGNLYQYTRGNPIWYIDPSGLGSQVWDGMFNDTFASRVVESGYAIGQAIYAGVTPMELDSELQRNHNPLQLAGKDYQPYWVKPVTEASVATASLAVAVATGGMALELGGGAALIPTTFNVVTNTSMTIAGNNGKPMTLGDLTNIGVSTAAGNLPGAMGLGKIGTLGGPPGIMTNTVVSGMAGAINSGLSQAMNTGGDVNMNRVAWDAMAAMWANGPNSAFVGLGNGDGARIPLEAEIVGNIWAGMIGLVWAPASELIFGKKQ
jgi:RHS repeat-associated protein